MSCRDVDPNLLYPDPDPVRIQINKINKLFSKHLLKVNKNFDKLEELFVSMDVFRDIYI